MLSRTRFVLGLALVFAIATLVVMSGSQAQHSDGTGGGEATSGLITSVPRTMTYQGLLEDETGDPVEDGTYWICFSIFDVENGGSPVWDDCLDVEVAGGLFSVILGEPDDLALPFDVDYYMELEVDSEILTPRQKLNMSAYAARADTAEFAESATEAGNAEMVDGIHASPSPQADQLLALDGSGMFPPSVIPPVSDADMVDGFHANGTPLPNMLLALDDNAKFTNAALYTGHGSGLNADMVDGYEGASLEESAEIDQDIASHAGISNAHHPRYTDPEARNAADDITSWGHTNLVTNLNADRVDNFEGASLEESAEIDGDIATHASNAGAHHAPVTSVNGLSGGTITSTTSINGQFSTATGNDINSGDDVRAWDNKASLIYDAGYGGYGGCVTYTPNQNRLCLVGVLSGTSGMNGGFWAYRDGSSRGGYYVATDNGGDLFLNNSSGSNTIFLDGSTGTIYKNTNNFWLDHPYDAEKMIVYSSIEGPEAAAYIRGTATLEKGAAYVQYPDHFKWVANTNTLTVHVTPLSADSKGLAIIEKEAAGFRVRELMNGKGIYDFDYLVQAVRKGHETFEVIRDKIIPGQPEAAEVD